MAYIKFVLLILFLYNTTQQLTSNDFKVIFTEFVQPYLL